MIRLIKTLWNRFIDLLSNRKLKEKPPDEDLPKEITVVSCKVRYIKLKENEN